MALQQFTAGQTLTAAAMNTLQASDYNYTRKVVTAATYTTVLEDRGQLLEFQNAGGTTVTIPLNSSVAYSIGDTLEIVNGSTATITIVGDAGVTIEATGDITSLTSEWQKCQLLKRETNNWVLTGITTVSILDSAITNADVSTSAAIAHSKLANITAGQVLLGNASNVPTATALSGDITVTSGGVTAIGSGVIVNADINAAAAIDKTKIAGTAITAADTGTITGTMIADDAITTGKIANDTILNADIKSNAAISHSKLANITAGQVLLGNASNVPTATALSGDITIDSSGVTSITPGVIVNADISSTAAIEITKIADVTIDTKTSNYTLVLADKNKFIEMNLAGANTVSVPTNSVAFPIGSQIHITQYGAGKTQVVAVTPGTTTIRSNPSAGNGAYIRAQYSSATLIKRATEEWYLVGDLSAT